VVLRLLQFQAVGTALKMLLLGCRCTMLLIHIKAGDNYSIAADFKIDFVYEW
jgi:hypothetical protein